MAAKSLGQIRRNLVLQGNCNSKYTIIGDSMVKYLELEDCYTQAVRGGKVIDIINAINNDIIQVGYHTILVHVGTNNIFKSSPSVFVHEYETLISIIKGRNPTGGIIISPIITRPRDYSDSHEVVLDINKRTELMAIREKIQMLSHFKSFKSGKIPKREMFSNDKLHLSDDGEFQLGTCFANALKTAIKTY
jgi:hypothetical protein